MKFKKIKKYENEESIGADVSKTLSGTCSSIILKHMPDMHLLQVGIHVSSLCLSGCFNVDHLVI
jgi:hypothetical protein